MFRPTRLCLSATSKRIKRVKVQLLKDFPQFQLSKGQVTDVKPSLMRNYLHNFNGARYILKDTDVDTVLLKSYKVNEASTQKDQQPAAKLMSKAQVKEGRALEKMLGKPREKKVLDNDISLKDVYIPGLDA
ncbi:hypothetical protein KAFR_0F00780 [Kazachstania africana CBS 2517]|uniref:Ribosomal protein L9 domain-containing protein n=1 Tax=Kazachstania africana (strain ATCC 22294 / BCRC 22015 / CBS 2517 / CECT 1963 / NBRC 1671 / NRRL Y-8276) TaxID=1071382 RepID=H2AWC5_KAZAF|nr:hypothetical protein KAFR_0F00780 [Kazachstania africana CBS 2517]CCF58675.1 hypothetical protein KAFR_0F00780 [Kazachstania africana CBS 2517]